VRLPPDLTAACGPRLRGRLGAEPRAPPRSAGAHLRV